MESYRVEGGGHTSMYDTEDHALSAALEISRRKAAVVVVYKPIFRIEPGEPTVTAAVVSDSVAGKLRML